MPVKLHSTTTNYPSHNSTTRYVPTATQTTTPTMSQNQHHRHDPNRAKTAPQYSKPHSNSPNPRVRTTPSSNKHPVLITYAQGAQYVVQHVEDATQLKLLLAESEKCSVSRTSRNWRRRMVSVVRGRVFVCASCPLD